MNATGLLPQCVRPSSSFRHFSIGENRCRWCGDERLVVLRERREHRVLRCWRCEFVTLKTGLDETRLGETYQDYLPTDEASIARWEREQRPVIRRAVREIERRAPGRKLLEIGAGYGFFLEAARAAGFEVHGLEPSATGRRIARERAELALRPETLEVALEDTLADAPLAPASFDAVAAFYVIEHLPDPRAFLAAAARTLRPGGLLMLRWPHSTPLVRILDVFQVDHDLYHAPWHLSDFTPATMERAFLETGFERVVTRTFGGTAAGGRLATLFSRGAAALSDALELASGAGWHLPGVSKTTFGFRRDDGVPDA